MTASIPQLSSLQDLIKQFIELYPNRGGSLVKHETGTWREVSRFYDLPDDEIVRAISSAQTLVRAANWDTRTKFTVLNINAESNYHNQLTLWQLQNSLAQKGVHKIRIYQSSESGGWHVYIFWNDWVSSTRSAAVISAVLMSAGFQIEPEVLEVFPSKKALRLPLQTGFSWLNESGRVIMRRSEISLEGALALYLDEAVKFANEASWLDSDHANEVSRLFQQQQEQQEQQQKLEQQKVEQQQLQQQQQQKRAILTVVKSMAPEPVAEQAVERKQEVPKAETETPSDLVAEETDSPDFSPEDVLPELVVGDFSQETFVSDSESEEPALIEEYPEGVPAHLASSGDDFDAEDTLSPQLVSQAPPLNFDTHEDALRHESITEETGSLDFSVEAPIAVDGLAEKDWPQQPSGEDSNFGLSGDASLSEEQEVDELELSADQTVTPALIAKRVWTPELVAEEAWPIDDAADNVDADFPPVVEQVMQIRRSSSTVNNQQLSLPLPNIHGSNTESTSSEIDDAPPMVSANSSDQPEGQESIDFSPAKVVTLTQRASGIVRELVEEEIPEIAYDTEPEADTSTKPNAEENSRAATAKHSKTNDQDNSSLLRGKQRLNNVVNSGPSDMQRRRRPPRNTTRERPSPGFPPTQA